MTGTIEAVQPLRRMTLKRFILVAIALTAGSAQMPLPMNQPSPSPAVIMPPPPAPPPPKVEVPAIPQMDAPPRAPSVNVAPRKSFSGRIKDCLDDTTAAGLGPTERAAYSRGCANR